jgi:hypothetical protein
LENKASACDVLMPSALRALSNCDSVIEPPSAFICENRLCNGFEELVVVVPVVVPLCDVWLCASSNALIISGEICAEPLADPVLVVPALELDRIVEASNRPLLWLEPVDDVDADPDAVDDDDFGEVSKPRMSRADVAAPRANNMAILQTAPRAAARTRAVTRASDVP